MSQLNVVGMDPSLRNWGLALGQYDLSNGMLQIHSLDVINPVLPTGKQTRQNSKDILSAFQLAEGSLAALRGAQAVFVEVPIGSQSARAMASYGICVGVLGTLRAQGIPFFEVTPTEVKQIATGCKTATKREMIQWAYDFHPTANWPFYSKNGQTLISEAKAEHMADAVAAIHAGIAGPEFQRWQAMSRQLLDTL